MVEPLRRSMERHPLLWVAGLAALAVLAADRYLAAGLTGAGVLVVLLLWVRAWRLLIGGCLLALVAGGLQGSKVSRRADLSLSMGAQVSGRIEARLLEEARSSWRGWSALAETSAGDRVWLIGQGSSVPSGSVVAGRGVYQPPPGPRNPGQFDMRPWLERRGAFAVFRSDGILSVEKPPPDWRVAGSQVRSGFREVVTRGLDPLSREAAVIRAVVIGEHPDDDVLIEPFRRSGTLHVFAVSGLHVGMVGLIGWMALRMFGVSRRGAVIPLIALMFGYAWLTGMKPPAIRAAWMGAVVLGAFWFRRRPDLVNALGLAALLMLLRDGDLLFQAGVQLSFGVVLAIGLLHHGVGRAFEWMRRAEPYLPRSLYGPWRERWLGLRRRVADMLTVSGSAWLGSAPLTAWHFGLMTPVSIIASVSLFVVVFPLLGLALLSAFVSPLPGVSEVLNKGNARLAGAALWIAKTGSAIPGGNFAVPHGRPADEFLVIYDVGADGAAVWRSDENCLLIDGAGRRSFEWVVMPSLREYAVRPRRFVVSHPDGGHVGGLIEAIDAFPITEGLVPVLRSKSSNYRALTSACETRGVRLFRGRKGEVFPLGGDSDFRILWEPNPWSWNSVADERVMPIMLNWRGWRILFMADAGWAIERSMIESGVDLRADVIVGGRHLHDASLGASFLEKTGARAIIATHSDFPPEQQLPNWWLRSCESKGIHVFHQGDSGAVSFVLEEGELVLRGYVDGKVIRLKKP